MAEAGVKVTAWREHRQNSLLGFATVEIPKWSFRIIDLTVHEKGGKRWISLPAKPQLDANKQPIIKEGKLQYAPVMAFMDAQVGARFAQAVIAALADRLPPIAVDAQE